MVSTPSVMQVQSRRAMGLMRTPLPTGCSGVSSPERACRLGTCAAGAKVWVVPESDLHAVFTKQAQARSVCCCLSQWTGLTQNRHTRQDKIFCHSRPAGCRCCQASCHGQGGSRIPPGRRLLPNGVSRSASHPPSLDNNALELGLALAAEPSLARSCMPSSIHPG